MVLSISSSRRREKNHKSELTSHSRVLLLDSGPQIAGVVPGSEVTKQTEADESMVVYTFDQT